MKEPFDESTLARLQVFTPRAVGKLVVATPDEFWRTTPPPDPDEKLMVPTMDAACADVMKASEANAAMRGMGIFMFRTGMDVRGGPEQDLPRRFSRMRNM